MKASLDFEHVQISDVNEMYFPSGSTNSFSTVFLDYYTLEAA
jgi:hypothetical protein